MCLASQEWIDAGLIQWKKVVLRPVIADSAFQIVCLAVARPMAYFMYPSLITVFVTKFCATMELIAQSTIGIFTYNDLHELHVWCGWVCMMGGCIPRPGTVSAGSPREIFASWLTPARASPELPASSTC